MKEKFCIITGANSGIGYETALALAKEGAHVLMVSRSKTKGEAARAQVQSESGNPKVELMLCDFSSQADIRRFAGEVKSRFKKIDVLVNNVGAINPERTVTVDGLETTFATNHLGYFLITMLLVDELKAAPAARIVNVASEASRMNVLELDAPNMETSYSPMRAYCQSKLMNIMFSNALARRLIGTAVTTNAMHPGGVNTNFASEGGGVMGFFFRLAKPLMRTPQQGADTVIWLASAPELDGATGKYFQDRKELTPVGTALDETLQEKLWSLSETLTQRK
jgi:NAD(P)-dependent dehydrogenase (short-subunit alcohol dehydrogenase family)